MIQFVILSSLLVPVILSSAVGSYSENPAAIRLVKYLLDDTRYDRNVRPVNNHSKPVTIRIRMNLYQILEVNEPQQNILLYVWMTQEWEDEFLGWNPLDYDDMTSLVLPYHTVWLPDTYLYNSLEMTRETTERWISVILNTQMPPTPSPYQFYPQSRPEEPKPRDFPVAKVTFQYPAMYRFSCKMYILYFPFDMQNCTLTFGSWTYDAAGIDYYTMKEEVTFESYVPNEEWVVANFTMYRYSVKYACCPVPYVLLKMFFVIERKPLYYLVNLVIPTVIITLIAVIGFFMPATTTGERSEKVNLGITTLLAMSILLLMVSDQMPTTSDFIPLMGFFFLTIIILISVGTTATSFIIMLQRQGHYGRKIPKWVKRFTFHSLAPVVCLSLPEELREDEDDDSEEKRDNMGTFIVNSESSHRSLSMPRGGGNIADCSPGEAVLVSQLLDIRKQMRALQLLISSANEPDTNLLEWDFLATVLDRVFLIFFVLGLVLVTLCFIIIGLTADQSKFLLRESK